MDNANSKEYLDKILSQVLENMKRTAHAPSVQMTDVPRDSLGMNDDDEAALDDLDDDENPDKRITERKADKYVQKNGELSDSEDEDMRNRPSSRKRRIQQNYRHIMDVGANDSGVETGSGMGTPQQGSSLPDDADEMNIDSIEDPVDQTPSPQTEAVNGSAAVSGRQSPSQGIGHDEDIEMGEADADDAEGNGTADTSDAQPIEEESTITVQQRRTPAPQQHSTEDMAPVPAPTVEAPTATTNNGNTTAEAATVAVSPAATAMEPEATKEAAIKEEVSGDDELARTQEQGCMEREAVDADGEAYMEGMAKAEAAE